MVLEIKKNNLDYLEINFIIDPFHTAAMFARNNRFRTPCLQLT